MISQFLISQFYIPHNYLSLKKYFFMSVCENENYIHWIKNIFDDCISTPMEITSFSFGLFADVIRVICAFPQLISNYKTKDVSGISPFLFGLIWAGSCLTMFGVVFNHGSFTQILTGIIDLFFDSALFFQFIYYQYIYNNVKCRRFKFNEIKNIENFESDETNSKTTSNDEDDNGNEMDDINEMDGNEVDNNIPKFVDSSKSSTTGLMLNALIASGSAFNWADPYQGRELVGTIFGWIGTFIFIGSRIPQVVKNFKQKQVKDLSLTFVILMVASNLSYVASVLFRSKNLVYIWMQVPYLTGSFVPMLFDVITLIQYGVYSKKKNNIIVDGEDDEKCKPLNEIL
ncbi:PQ loop repeat family protein [Tritrichomonas foetus]|uniref:PQ loop repeat family protein n=1 Tax=Tritrichomonas foetus TaxID=1144522 RepID=A0A1J4KTU9_9EUKA|nr:PQ loop repeat family protein [Tritrichomonas foetus]|eukprot:OHT14687.1 PQ loop repeat family protein [Tritrichomonas foetus]